MGLCYYILDRELKSAINKLPIHFDGGFKGIDIATDCARSARKHCPDPIALHRDKDRVGRSYTAGTCSPLRQVKLMPIPLLRTADVRRSGPFFIDICRWRRLTTMETTQSTHGGWNPT